MLTKPELVLKKHFFLLLSMLKTSSAQHNGSKPQLNEISTTQRIATTQWKQAATQRN